MFSETLGIFLSTVLFLSFQFCGIVIIGCFFKKKSTSFIVLTGSVIGTVSFQWLPVLVAFFFGFSVFTHVLSLASIAVFTGILCYMLKFRFRLKINRFSLQVFIFGLIIFAITFYLILTSFSMSNGAYMSSQNTYGDLSLHLGFITSIANGAVYPPEYPIFTGNLLSYPFLCDSISSSFYVFGAPLTFSYIFPMFFALAQLIMGAIMFFKSWLIRTYKVVLALVLFFLNGGFGFFYFMSGTEENPNNFTRIFTDFYQTPTNYNEENIRWSNIIVDMLVPQRSTLFGWAVLFTCIYVLFIAINKKDRKLFILVGIFAGALPMIHTHSFLALFMVSAVWLVIEMIGKAYKKCDYFWVKALLVIFPISLTFIQTLISSKETPWLLIIVLVALALFVTIPIFLLFKSNSSRKVLYNWLPYIIIAGVLATPQLFFWTFSQTGDGSYIAGYFNWSNNGDNYLWFYLKNIGLVALFYFPMILSANRKTIKIISPVIMIFFIADLVRFQPNAYDNNKLLYIAYFLLCGALSEFAVNLLMSLKDKTVRYSLAVMFILFASFSSILTIGRELIAEYEVIGKNHVDATNYVNDNIEDKSAIFLTGTNHNNAITALSGHSIVCGSEVFLFYHGIDYALRQQHMKEMFENPQYNSKLYELYDVKYIYISDYENSDYDVDISYFEQNHDKIYYNDTVQIYEYRN